MQLIVLGMHRSGTSVLARLLNLMGAYFGPEGISTGANDENPKGFWERRDVRMLNDSVLHAMGCDWNRVRDFNAADLPEPVIADFFKSASKLVLEMDAHRPWLLKEPRLCLLLPLWRKVLEVPICVQILRNPVEVAASLRKRNDIPMEAGLALWEKYVRSAMSASSGLPSLLVLHRQLMLEPMNVAAQLLRQLESAGVVGLRMPSEREISTFVCDDLYRERESSSNMVAHSKKPQAALFRDLMAGDVAPADVGIGLTSASKKALAEYESSLPPLKPKPDLSILSQSELILRAKVELQNQEVRLVREMSSRLKSELKHRDGMVAFMEAEFKIARESAAKLERELEQANQKLLASQQALHAMTEQAAWREGELKQRDECIAKLEQDARTAHETLARTNSEFMQVRENLLNKSGELELLLLAKADAERSVAERFREIEQLTMMLIGRDHELERADGKACSAEKKIVKITHRLQEKEVELAQLVSLLSAKSIKLKQAEDHLAELTGSMAWRAVTPLREALLWFRAGDRSISGDLDTIRRSDWFDADWYLERNQDVAESGVDPVDHYLNHGAAEGRDPGPEFDTKFYLASHPDVAASGLNPLLHYIRSGKSEGRAIKADERK